MQIDELAVGQEVTILTLINEHQLEFKTTIEDVNNRRHFILVAPIYKDDKLLSFSSPGLITHLIVTFADAKPQIFKNVTIESMQKDATSCCYFITTTDESSTLNRRKNFRCSISIESQIVLASTQTPYRGIVRDVSESGFSFTFLDDISAETGQLVHFLLKDQIDEIKEKFSLHLYGMIVRKQTLENGKIVYGCKLVNYCRGLNTYIAKKERLQLQKQRGMQ